MARANCNGQGIQLCFTHKVSGLLGVSQQLIHGQLAIGTMTIFFVALHGFERTQAAELTLNGNAQLMCHVDDLLGDRDVVIVVSNRLAVFFQRAVHHDA